MSRYAEPDLKAAALITGANFSNCPRASIAEASQRDFRIVVVANAISGSDARDEAEMVNIGVTVVSIEELLAKWSDAA
jgi:hypothetical protein